MPKQLKELHIKVVPPTEAPQNGTNAQASRLTDCPLAADVASFARVAEFGQSSIRARPLPRFARASGGASAAADRPSAPRDHPVRRASGIGQEIRAEAARGRLRSLPFRGSFHRRSIGARHLKAIGWRASGASLPSAGNTAIFYRSWYRRVLDDRVLRPDRRGMRSRARSTRSTSSRRSSATTAR